MENQQNSTITNINKLIAIVVNSPWIEIITSAWKVGRKLIRGLADEGMFEVLEYESKLELLDAVGKSASFSKRKKIRYLQNNIIAYPDYAWGDGVILQNYHCTPGLAVDKYRSGYKTYVLISLREVKNKGDEDEFNINWDIKNGFLKSDGFWDTDISTRTHTVKINVIFPKSRPPQRSVIFEANIGKSQELDAKAKKRLPDGRWLVSWEMKKPRLYEHYMLKWWW